MPSSRLAPTQGDSLVQAQSRRHRTWHRFAARQHRRDRLGRHRATAAAASAPSPHGRERVPGAHRGSRSPASTPRTTCPPKDVRKFDPFVPFGFAAAVQAVQDSGFEVTEENSPRDRRGHGRRHRRPEHHRGDHREVARVEDAAQDLPVLHPGQHHQCRCRARSRSTSAARPEPRAGHRLHDLDARHRHRGAHASSTATPTS